MHLLEHIPCFDLESAPALAETLFGICASARLLSSERDQNFLLTDGSGEKFVLKIANALEERALLEAQNAVLSHLESQISFCPRVVPTTAGEQMAPVESPDKSTYFVRLVRYIPGVPLSEIKPHSSELLHDLGRKLGELDHALADFDHPAIHRDFNWDLSNGLWVLSEFGRLIRDERLRNLVCKCGNDFEADLSRLTPKLRRSVIHGDANDYNVLVGRERMTVVGLIDFGDMVHSYTVGDLAIAIAYVVLDKPDPVAAAKEVVGGYVHEYSLKDHELDALWGLVLMRLCMSVCLAAYQQRQRPENEYLEISQRAIRDSLPALVAIDPRVAAEAFRKATGQYEPVARRQNLRC